MHTEIHTLIHLKQGRKRPLDTPKRRIERKKGRKRDIEREGEIREIERGERDREVTGIERVKVRVKSS